METNNVVAAKSSRRKLLPLLLIVVMAIAVFAVVWNAKAETRCCADDICCMHSLAVEKQLEEGVEARPGVKFTYKMTLSPEAYNFEESCLDSVTHVHGILYNADGSFANAADENENIIIPSTFKLEADHSFTFQLEAGQFIVFDKPDGWSINYTAADQAFKKDDPSFDYGDRCWNPSCKLPFEWTGCSYVVNEVIDDSVKKLGYDFKDVVVKTSIGDLNAQSFSSSELPGVKLLRGYGGSKMFATNAAVSRWGDYFRDAPGDVFETANPSWVGKSKSGGDCKLPVCVRTEDGSIYWVEDIKGSDFTLKKIDASNLDNAVLNILNGHFPGGDSVILNVADGEKLQYGYVFGVHQTDMGWESYRLKWADSLCVIDDISEKVWVDAPWMAYWPCEEVYSFDENDRGKPLYCDYANRAYKIAYEDEGKGLGGLVDNALFKVDSLVSETGLYGNFPASSYSYYGDYWADAKWTKACQTSKEGWFPLAYDRYPEYARDPFDGTIYVIHDPNLNYEDVADDEGSSSYPVKEYESLEDVMRDELEPGYKYYLGDMEGQIWWPTEHGFEFDDGPFRWDFETKTFVHALKDNPVYEVGEASFPAGDRKQIVKPDGDFEFPQLYLGVMAPLEAVYMKMPVTVSFTNTGRLAPVYKPLAITKEIIPAFDENGEELGTDTDVDTKTSFKFELTVSPGFDSDKGPLYAGRTVSGTIIDSEGLTSEPDEFSFDEKHTISFELQAGESIVFDEMPFAPDDTDGHYIVKEVSSSFEPSEGKPGYTLESVSADAGVCTVLESTDPRFEAGILGTAEGTLGNEGMTTVTVTNKQGTPPPPPPPTPDDTDKTATVTISKSLEGAANNDAKFSFEVIVSPEWCSLGYFIGTNTEPVSVLGTIKNKSNDEPVDSEQPKSYPVVNNVIKGIELKADQYITFENVPYESVEGKPGTIIVNELLSGEVANSYELKSYEVKEGNELGFNKADEKKIANSDSKVSSLLAPAGATEQTATGAYGEFVGDKFSVTFTNRPATHEPGTHTLTVTKNLENFDFGKYESANVAFNVYRFDTEAERVAFLRGGTAASATWQGALAMRLTANGVQSTELSGLTDGFYAVEELAATNMKTVGVARKPVDDEQFVVTFDNSFEDQNVYENSIVNSYKKETDENGKITWKRYQNGVQVNQDGVRVNQNGVPVTK